MLMWSTNYYTVLTRVVYCFKMCIASCATLYDNSLLKYLQQAQVVSLQVTASIVYDGCHSFSISIWGTIESMYFNGNYIISKE